LGRHRLAAPNTRRDVQTRSIQQRFQIAGFLHMQPPVPRYSAAAVRSDRLWLHHECSHLTNGRGSLHRRWRVIERPSKWAGFANCSGPAQSLAHGPATLHPRIRRKHRYENQNSGASAGELSRANDGRVRPGAQERLRPIRAPRSASAPRRPHRSPRSGRRPIRTVGSSGQPASMASSAHETTVHLKVRFSVAAHLGSALVVLRQAFPCGEQ